MPWAAEPTKQQLLFHPGLASLLATCIGAVAGQCWLLKPAPHLALCPPFTPLRAANELPLYRPAETKRGLKPTSSRSGLAAGTQCNRSRVRLLSSISTTCGVGVAIPESCPSGENGQSKEGKSKPAGW